MFKNFFINSGMGKGKGRLTSFDDALMNSGVGNYNLVRVSSILPAGCERVESVNLNEGEVLHVAYAEITSNFPNEVVSAAVSVGIPKDRTKVGVIMEYSAKRSEKDTVRIVENMVKEAMGKRECSIEYIITSSCEAFSQENEYVTAFAGLAMW